MAIDRSVERGRTEIVLGCPIRSRAIAFDEVVELVRIFLAAEVEPRVLGQFGGVFHRPALAVFGQFGRRFAEVELAFLAIGVKAAIGANMLIFVVILRCDSSLQFTESCADRAVLETERAEDLVVYVAWKRRLCSMLPATSDGRAEEPVEQVEGWAA